MDFNNFGVLVLHGLVLCGLEVNAGDDVERDEVLFHTDAALTPYKLHSKNDGARLTYYTEDLGVLIQSPITEVSQTFSYADGVGQTTVVIGTFAGEGTFIWEQTDREKIGAFDVGVSAC